MITLAAAVTETPFADRLSKMLWQAYGAPVKFVAVVALIVVVGIPLVVFLRKLTR